MISEYKYWSRTSWRFSLLQPGNEENKEMDLMMNKWMLYRLYIWERTNKAKRGMQLATKSLNIFENDDSRRAIKVISLANVSAILSFPLSTSLSPESWNMPLAPSYGWVAHLENCLSDNFLCLVTVLYSNLGFLIPRAVLPPSKVVKVMKRELSLLPREYVNFVSGRMS
jgi:hypothetical protein